MSAGSLGEAPDLRALSREDALNALARARLETATGSLDRAWQACHEAAQIGRRLGDATILADAATLIEGPAVTSHQTRAAQRALCQQALVLLGDTDIVRRRRVEAQLRVLSTGWVQAESVPAAPVSSEDAHDRFISLQIEYSETPRPGFVEARLAIAARLRTLAWSSGQDDLLAWSSLWRLDALAQSGRRVELNAEFLQLTAVVQRLASPAWQWRTASVRACLALLDDHIEDVADLAAEAARRGIEAGVEEAAFLALVIRSDLAVRTGEGLVEVEREVRRALADAPFFAQSWRALLLVALGREDEAIQIWRALAEYIDEVPPTSAEWMIVAAAHAELSIIATDTDAASRLYEILLPFAGLHVVASVLTPYSGPVSLVLGRLAQFLHRPATARIHLAQAIGESDRMHSRRFSASARSALAELGGAHPVLSPREAQVAEAVTAGLTNREIAIRLFLSERTVENHVSSILRRLDVPNRAAVAAWEAANR